jgi:hypothetical protein
MALSLSTTLPAPFFSIGSPSRALEGRWRWIQCCFVAALVDPQIQIYIRSSSSSSSLPPSPLCPMTRITCWSVQSGSGSHGQLQRSPIEVPVSEGYIGRYTDQSGKGKRHPHPNLRLAMVRAVTVF